ETALLRRADARRGGGGARHRGADRASLVGLCPRVPAEGNEQPRYLGAGFRGAEDAVSASMKRSIKRRDFVARAGVLAGASLLHGAAAQSSASATHVSIGGRPKPVVIASANGNVS